MSVIESGSMLGVLGGGQLGAMFAAAARRLGYRVAVWDPDPDAPALRSADLPISAPFSEGSALPRFLDSIRAATYEWENVPADTCQLIEQRVPVRPGSAVLRLLQNRLQQKRFFSERALAVTPFLGVESVDALDLAQKLGFPCLVKTATSGYDGKGQWRVDNLDELHRLRRELEPRTAAETSLVVERLVPFHKELSVVVVRAADHQVRLYPVAENVHEGGILRLSRVPAAVSPDVGERATSLARAAVDALGGIGVFCVELFLLDDGALFINEVAPRPHNSGHYTLDACTVSQFEQQVRALCGLPLGEVRLLSPAVMVNLIGDEVRTMQSREELQRLLATAGAAVHLYGKPAVRPRRKMGHVTYVAEKAEAAWDAACALRTRLTAGNP